MTDLLSDHANPRVSVICAAHDGLPHLRATIESLRAQRLRDFEAVFVDDASADGTAALLAGVDDPRFRVVRHPENLGLVRSRNHAIELARGALIAVTDQDDPSHPDRLARQVAFLDAHPGASAVYTLIRSVDAAGRPRPGVADWHYSGQQARAALVFHNFVTHSTLTFRRERVGSPVYAGDFPLCEDYNLLVRLADAGDGLHAIRAPLVDYRYHDANHTLVSAPTMGERSRALRRALLGRLGVAATDGEMDVHGAFEGLPASTELSLLERCGRWLDHLVDANRRSGYVPTADFDAVAAAVWLELAHKFSRHARAAWSVYARGPRRGLATEHRRSVASLWLKCMLPIRREGRVIRSHR